VTSIKFGTSGWRGLIARDFTFENVRFAAQGIADYLKEGVSRRATAQYIARLVSRATITGIPMEGAEAHRVN
jgi:phosphomannomutase